MVLSTIGLLLQLLVVPTRDDAAILRSARQAQQRFESLRRARLPIDWRGGSGGRCDARIGRYCYWYDTTDSKPIPEGRAISDARERLIRGLDTASWQNPRDPWIAGQLVRYLLEAGRSDSAVAAASRCQADRWWCSALAGLALHVGERYPSADSAYADALAAMPVEQRCAWLDVRELLPSDLASQLGRTGCEERAELGERLVRLAQPLWMLPGRDWRTEILARRTMALLLAHAAHPQMSWGDDSRELLMRFGWSEWFTRSEATGMYAASVVTGHDREPSYNVFPDVHAVRASRVAASDWQLRAQFARSRYAPRSVLRLGSLRHQLARFAHGDSLLVAVRFAPTDSALLRDSLRGSIVALVHDSLEGTPLREMRGVAVIRSDTSVVSVEVLGAQSKHAERARYTIEPLARVAGSVLSDLLLFAPDGQAPENLEAALGTALPDARVSAHSPLGVYWELDGGSGARASAVLSLTVRPVHVGAVRRVATKLHLAPPLAPVRLRWQAAVESRHGQQVTLRLPENARGRYRVELTLQRATGPLLTSAREIEIEP
jgi:hypothetical protein